MSPDDETPDDARRSTSSADKGAKPRIVRPAPQPPTEAPQSARQPSKSPTKSPAKSTSKSIAKSESDSSGKAGAAGAATTPSKKARPRPKTVASKVDAVLPTAQTQPPPEPAPQSESVSAPQPRLEVPAQRATGWHLLLKVGRPRASRGQFVVALLCGLLGFALVTQVHSESNVGLSSARQADLVDVLDSLSAKSDQLRSQITDEQNTLSKLTGGTDQTQAALQEAQERATTLRILAGTVGASGPGIDLHIDDPGHKVTADVLLDTLEELRDAGAEAVEIRGAQAAGSTTANTNSSAPESAAATPSSTHGGPLGVRLVASSYFVDPDDGQGVIVDGTLLLPPYDILAIGDPPTLDQAMGIPGGVLDTLKGRSASGTVTDLDTVRITALHALTPPKYARPAASPPA